MFLCLFLYSVSSYEVVIVMRKETFSLLLGLHSEELKMCCITVYMFVIDTHIRLLLQIVLNYQYHDE
jgi:hypothetical protein